MLKALILSIALSGQVWFCPDVCPRHCVCYRMSGLVETTREYDVIQYDENWYRVPIINGLVPDVSYTKFTDGSTRIILDYSRRTLYAECVTYARSIKEQPKKPLEIKKPEDPKFDGTKRPSDVSAIEKAVSPNYERPE